MIDLLFVEDDAAFRETHGDALRAAGFHVREAASVESALDLITEKLPEVILLDISMPPGRMGGIELLLWLQHRHVKVPVVIFTGYEDVLDRDIIRRLGVTTIVTKGRVSTRELADVLTRTALVEHRSAP
jgi:CheY-like chemotaxis protein